MSGVKVGSIAGQRFGKLTALRLAEAEDGRAHKWHFRCACGNQKVYPAYQARNGMRAHCGCDPGYVLRAILEYQNKTAPETR